VHAHSASGVDRAAELVDQPSPLGSIHHRLQELRLHNVGYNASRVTLVMEHQRCYKTHK